MPNRLDEIRNKYAGKHVVYRLVDPRDCSVFYIGYTSQYGVRHKAHAGDRKNPEKADRIRDIRLAGHSVLMQVVDAFDEQFPALIREYELIRSMPGLTNVEGRNFRRGNVDLLLRKPVRKAYPDDPLRGREGRVACACCAYALMTADRKRRGRRRTGHCTVAARPR
jgi:hypothetical protein